MKLFQVVGALLLLALSNGIVREASAAPSNQQANQQIDNAINTHYAGADIDTAEKKLLEVIKSCGPGCSPAVLARAWMYVGIVRGGGRDDSAGALEAFRAAKTADPNVKLDDIFATDLTKRVFEQAKPTPGGAMPLIGDIRERAAQPEAVTSIQCTLTAVNEVETQRPIPISCRTAPGADSVVLSYRHESSTRWRQVQLTRQADAWTGQIPCADTTQIGVLSYRLQALSAQGQEVDALGDEQDPVELNLVQETAVPPPALPNQAPPASCRPKKKVEPAGPKLGSYGDACTDVAECQGGLTCKDGKCAADVSCDSDAECLTGSCIDNVCVTPDGDCEGDDCETASRVPGNWFGLQGGIDFATMSGSQVCSRAADPAFACFEGEDPYRGLPNNNFAGGVEGGFRAATSRVMLSYERVISSMFSLEGRFGFAFNGGPESKKSEGGDNSTFNPLHAEGRAKLYFTKVYKEDASGLKGPSGFVMVGGGMAQVDPHVVVPVAECRTDTMNTGGMITISESENRCILSENRALEIKRLDVYRRLGLGFASAGVGFRYGFGKHVAAIASINAQLLLPTVGFTVSPSLGFAAGF